MKLSYSSAVEFSEADSIYQKVQAQKKAGELGFASLPYQKDLSQILALAAELKAKFKDGVMAAYRRSLELGKGKTGG